MYFISLIKDIKNKIAKVLRKQTDERTDSGNGNTGMKYKLSDESVVWIFSGEGARFASAVFLSQKLVENWIKKISLSGVLTAYPVNIDVYEWAVTKGFFTAKKDEQNQAAFIQKFSSASQEHYHYEDGNIS